MCLYSVTVVPLIDGRQFVLLTTRAVGTPVTRCKQDHCARDSMFSFIYRTWYTFITIWLYVFVRNALICLGIKLNLELMFNEVI